MAKSLVDTGGGPPPSGTSRTPLKLVEGLRCDECGRFGAFDLGERKLCEDCYRTCGSCCLEFGGDDLWSKEE